MAISRSISDKIIEKSSESLLKNCTSNKTSTGPECHSNKGLDTERFIDETVSTTAINRRRAAICSEELQRSSDRRKHPKFSSSDRVRKECEAAYLKLKSDRYVFSEQEKTLNNLERRKTLFLTENHAKKAFDTKNKLRYVSSAPNKLNQERSAMEDEDGVTLFDRRKKCIDKAKRKLTFDGEEYKKNSFLQPKKQVQRNSSLEATPSKATNNDCLKFHECYSLSGSKKSSAQVTRRLVFDTSAHKSEDRFNKKGKNRTLQTSQMNSTSVRKIYGSSGDVENGSKDNNNDDDDNDKSNKNGNGSNSKSDRILDRILVSHRNKRNRTDEKNILHSSTPFRIINHRKLEASHCELQLPLPSNGSNELKAINNVVTVQHCDIGNFSELHLKDNGNFQIQHRLVETDTSISTSMGDGGNATNSRPGERTPPKNKSAVTLSYAQITPDKHRKLTQQQALNNEECTSMPFPSPQALTNPYLVAVTAPDNDDSLPLTSTGSILECLESDRLRDFEIVKLLTIGSFNTVYKCVNYVDGINYVIKRSSNVLRDKEHERACKNQIFAHVALQHKYIEHYYSSWYEKSHIHIQTEYCSGGDLQEKINAGYIFSEAELIKLIKHVSRGLRHIHQQDLVHLNLAPSNILLFHKEASVKKKIVNDANSGAEISSRTVYKITGLSKVKRISSEQPGITKKDVFDFGVIIFKASTSGRMTPEVMQYFDTDSTIKIPIPYIYQCSPYINDVIKRALNADELARPDINCIVQQNKLANLSISVQRSGTPQPVNIGNIADN